MYELAKKYYEEHKDLNVPPNDIVDGVWPNKYQKEQKQVCLEKKRGKRLTNEQIERLESIGMNRRRKAVKVSRGIRKTG